MTKLLGASLAALLMGCSTPNYYYNKDVKDFVTPLQGGKKTGLLSQWYGVQKREPIIQGDKQPVYADIERIQKECSTDAGYKYEFSPLLSTPKEFKQKGSGDCDDFSVCKYYKLRQAGFKDNQINFWSGKYDGTPHVVVVVEVNNKEVVMDIMDASLPLAKNYFYKNFYPVYRYNATGWDTK